MMKNAADVILGGLTYWMFGYAVQYGLKGGNPFWGLGTFFVDDDVVRLRLNIKKTLVIYIFFNIVMINIFI